MSGPPRILAFDTSAAHCAAALLIGDRIVASAHEEMGRGQAERLFPMLEEILRYGDCSWTDLDAIGVGIGPGNFTGVRIAVSAARGLALSLGLPAVGVSTLEAQVCGVKGAVLSSSAASRGEVYLQSFNAGAESAPVVGNPHTVRLDLPARAEAACVGASAGVLASRVAGHVIEPALPLVEAIAHKALARRDNVGRARPSPLYIRPADAAPASDPPPVILP